MSDALFQALRWLVGQILCIFAGNGILCGLRFLKFVRSPLYRYQVNREWVAKTSGERWIFIVYCIFNFLCLIIAIIVITYLALLIIRLIEIPFIKH